MRVIGWSAGALAVASPLHELQQIPTRVTQDGITLRVTSRVSACGSEVHRRCVCQGHFASRWKQDPERQNQRRDRGPQQWQRQRRRRIETATAKTSASSFAYIPPPAAKPRQRTSGVLSSPPSAVILSPSRRHWPCSNAARILRARPTTSFSAIHPQKGDSLSILFGAILDPSGSSNVDHNNNLIEGEGSGGVSLWLDMRTAVLPAAQTLQLLYSDLRAREEALGRKPGDPDWILGRVPNPVEAVLFAGEPEGRAKEEAGSLGGALPCFQVLDGDGDDLDRVLSVPSGEPVGVGLDPAGGAAGVGGGAMAVVAAVQQQQQQQQRQRGEGDGGQREEAEALVLLRGVRPSVWEDEDMPTTLKIAASTCAGARTKTRLVVTVRSVGQLHNAAMAALAASQTQMLGQERKGNGANGGGGVVVLLIEPFAELWEAGLLYL